MKTLNCNFCASEKLTKVYPVADSKRGMVVYVCSMCGLVQSIQTKTYEKNHTVRISSSADWGNIRIGKSVSFLRYKDELAHWVSWKKFHSVLDIGSNRGAFVRWVHERYPRLTITAIEPDTHIIDDYTKLPKVTFTGKKFEDVPLASGSFDFIYCAHTLEHMDDPNEALTRCKDLLADDGYLFLEVPNIMDISYGDLVEEFFLDKHNYHFDQSILVEFLQSLGFRVVRTGDSKDRTYIQILAQKTGKPSSSKFPKEGKKRAQNMIKLIKTYEKSLASNRKKLKKIAEQLNTFMTRQRVVYWGGGRIFDALVRYGNLDTSKAIGLVDTYLSGKIKILHGLSVDTPSLLRMKTPDVVIVLAKSSTDLIRQEIQRFGIVNIITFNDLLTNVKD